MAGTITFHNAFASGTQISQLGSGTYDHIGFFGPNGTASAVEVESYQDTTFIVEPDGTEMAAASGVSKLMNCKWISSSGVQVSGQPGVNIANLNVFDSGNLSTYPDFVNRPSGTLLIRYQASGTTKVRTYQAKLYAYDATGLQTQAPPDVVVLMFEINASGLAYAAQSGAWATAHTTNTPLFFADHSSTNGYEPKNAHFWVAGISVRPTAIGVLDDWNLAFQVSYA
jgi:hypothetical protein